MRLFRKKVSPTQFRSYWQGEMLGYFPVPYNDELLYSCIARYAQHTGQENNQKAVIRDVFATQTAVAIPDLPSHLNNLVQNLSSIWSTNVNGLIGKHTLAPIYLPFLSESQADKVCHSMASEAGGNIHTRTGISASSVKQPDFFRYCPKCAKEQLSELGEMYWSRIHQLPGLESCVRHSCALEVSSVNFHPREKHFFHSASLECEAGSGSKAAINSQERKLCGMYAELLEKPYLEGLGPNRWMLFYRNLANELGFIKKSRVQHRDIYYYLQQKWNGSSFEKYLPGSADDNWLVSLFRKHRKSFHPLRHLIVLSVLVPESSMSEVLHSVRRLPVEPQTSVVCSISTKASKQEIEIHRRLWCELLLKYPLLGVKGLRTLSGGGSLYAWLYRNDFKWLMNNRPKNESTSKPRYHVDYSAWDDRNIVGLEGTLESLQSQTNRPRLTRTLFIKTLPRANSIEKHLNDLPLTRQWLELHSESVEDYQLLRLKLAYQKTIEHNLEVKRWRLLRLANIRKDLITPKIEQEIQYLERQGK